MDVQFSEIIFLLLFLVIDSGLQEVCFLQVAFLEVSIGWKTIDSPEELILKKGISVMGSFKIDVNQRDWQSEVNAEVVDQACNKADHSG